MHKSRARDESISRPHFCTSLSKIPSSRMSKREWSLADVKKSFKKKANATDSDSDEFETTCLRFWDIIAR